MSSKQASYIDTTDASATTDGFYCTAEIYDQYGNLVDLTGYNGAEKVGQHTADVATTGLTTEVSKNATTAAIYNANGGLLQITKGTYTMRNGTLNGISAVNGGAVYVGDGGTFILENATIQNCTAQNGGAIYVDDGGTLIINNGTIANCSATSSGGAIYVNKISGTYGGTVIINNADISSCWSNDNGGAIYLNTNKDIEINDATFSNCYSNNYGGAIYNLSPAKITMQGISITNTKAVKGFAMHLNRGDITFGGTIDSCLPFVNTSGSNGAIYLDNDTTLEITSGSKITNISAYKGAAVYMSDKVSLSLYDTDISNCHSSSEGGAICAKSSSNTMTMQGGSITNCSASGGNGGGAIYMYHTSSSTVIKCSLNGVYISDCTTIDGDGESGGAIYAQTVELQGCTITNCSSSGGGGAVYASTGYIYNCSISNCTSGKAGNTQSVYGGGALNIYGLTISDTNIDNCHALTTKGYGGAIILGAIKSVSNLNITNCSAVRGGGIYCANLLEITGTRISGCSATYGGAIYFSGSSSLTLTNCIIGDETATSYATASSYSNKATYGGGIYFTYGTLNLSNSTICYNYSSSEGGGIHSQDASTLTINVNNNAVIKYNAAYSSGGGVYLASSNKINVNPGGKISNNYAGSGGGVCVSGNNNGAGKNTQVNVQGGEISGNTATYGGGVDINIGTLNLSSGSIAGNHASMYGGGVCVSYADSYLNITGGCIGDSTKTTIANSSSYSNSATYDGGGIYMFSGTATFSGGSIAYNFSAGSNGRVDFSEYCGGGGVCIVGTAKFTLCGGSIKYNFAYNCSGGGIKVGNFVSWTNKNPTGGYLYITSGSVMYNSAAEGGGGIFNNGTCQITGGTFANNYDYDSDADVWNFFGALTIKTSIYNSSTVANSGYGTLTKTSAEDVDKQLNTNTLVLPDKILSISSLSCGSGKEYNLQLCVLPNDKQRLDVVLNKQQDDNDNE